jgi:hypothetical protein
MNEHEFQEIERQLRLTAPADAAPELRGAVLAQMQRELAAARWDRRLGRLAAVLLVAGVGLNAAMGLNGESTGRATLAEAPSQESLVRTAVAVAAATDAETGRRLAQQMAAWSGQSMTNEQLRALDAAMAAQATSEKDG